MHAPQVYPYIKNKVAFDSLALVSAGSAVNSGHQG